MSISCVLISPKRKLAGQLLIMQNFLHFTGHFLVEGTAGSSVLNKFSDGNTSDPKNSDHLNGTDKQKQSKGIKSSKIKLHRRWNISKVDDFETLFTIFFLYSVLYYHSLYLFVICDASDKICSLDSIFVTVHCNRDFLQ